MVNAAVDINYEGTFYKEGTKLPDNLVALFKENAKELLSDHIEINAKWVPIDSKGISGFVKEKKYGIKRLRDHFGIKDGDQGVPKKAEPDNSKMLRSRPPKKKKVLTKTEIMDLDKEEQVALLNELGVDKIPKLEKNRVSLILRLQ
ncbi:MAG: hypothetical protein CL811_06320 [Colwelliaceae bacterium]|jgi:hypothetical protein|nr:hypothetical protein [Colwelliaceae bacterium]|tara:strand:+ start:8932 stop:9369 length:438 start_codon:yes stop_codon:yes gene_type:complete